MEHFWNIAIHDLKTTLFDMEVDAVGYPHKLAQALRDDYLPSISYKVENSCLTQLNIGSLKYRRDKIQHVTTGQKIFFGIGVEDITKSLDQKLLSNNSFAFRNLGIPPFQCALDFTYTDEIIFTKFKKLLTASLTLVSRWRLTPATYPEGLSPSGFRV